MISLDCRRDEHLIQALVHGMNSQKQELREKRDAVEAGNCFLGGLSGLEVSGSGVSGSGAFRDFYYRGGIYYIYSL